METSPCIPPKDTLVVMSHPCPPNKYDVSFCHLVFWRQTPTPTLQQPDGKLPGGSGAAQTFYFLGTESLSHPRGVRGRSLGAYRIRHFGWMRRASCGGSAQLVLILLAETVTGWEEVPTPLLVHLPDVRLLGLGVGGVCRSPLEGLMLTQASHSTCCWAHLSSSNAPLPDQCVQSRPC